MGSPQHPDAGQFAHLQAAGQLQTLGSPTWVDVRNGSVDTTIEMPEESVSLLQLSW
jgi:xylan 1,4-beta-xylosidase